MSKTRKYPIIACGYHVNLHYLAEFLKLGCDDEPSPYDAALNLDFWYFHDLPRDQRKVHPKPDRYVRPDGTYDEVEVILRTRLEVIRKTDDIEERLHEMDSDREKCDNFVKSLASIYKIQDPFDVTSLIFDKKPWSPEPPVDL